MRSLKQCNLNKAFSISNNSLSSEQFSTANCFPQILDLHIVALILINNLVMQIEHTLAPVV